MPTKTGKPLSSYYGNDLTIDQNSNTGVDSTTRLVQDGFGNNTVISLSDDSFFIKPQNDDNTRVLNVQNAGGSSILVVDTTNSKVHAGVSQQPVNTQYAHFGTDATESGGFAADTHYMLPFAGKSISSATDHTIGTGTDPDLTLTVSTSADGLVNSIWHILDNITIDSVIWWSGSANSTGEATRTHLVAYSISAGGDLSSGTIIADSVVDITNAGYAQAYYQSLTIESADIDAGKVVAFIFRQDGTNGNYAINATIKYHIR